MKDEEEIRHLHGFIASYEDLPGGIWCIDEGPDMWMPTDDGVLGVEHCRIVRGVIRSEERYKREAVRFAQRLFERAGGPNLQVGVRFRKDYVFKDEVEQIAKDLVEVVSLNIPEKGGRRHLEMWRIPPKCRPSKVSEVDVSYWREPTDGFWSVGFGGAVPRLAASKVQAALDDKEPKLEAYRQDCDVIWLLVSLDGFSPSGWWNITKEAVETDYRTGFDRVILYEHFSGKTFEIAGNGIMCA